MSWRVSQIPAEPMHLPCDYVRILPHEWHILRQDLEYIASAQLACILKEFAELLFKHSEILPQCLA